MILHLMPIEFDYSGINNKVLRATTLKPHPQKPYRQNIVGIEITHSYQIPPFVELN